MKGNGEGYIEIERISEKPSVILEYLEKKIGLETSKSNYSQVIANAMDIPWTRDVFDRLIVADCMAHGLKLITKDRRILENYAGAVW